jgi:SAM-dependent methyltransferase
MDRISQGREFWNDTPCDAQPTFALRARFRYQKDGWLLGLLKRIAREHTNVLEVGCGQGTDGITLCGLLPAGARYIGVDMSDVSLGRAREAAAEVSGQLRVQPVFRQENAEQLGFPDASFDCVVSVGALHHSASTERAIAEVRRVLKPGGVAYVMLYRRWAPKLLVAHALRGIQAGLDTVFRTDRILYKASRAVRLAERTMGTAFYECFGVPILRSYTRAGMEVLFSDFRSVQLTAHGSGLPAVHALDSLNSRASQPSGYLWLAEASN